GSLCGHTELPVGRGRAAGDRAAGGDRDTVGQTERVAGERPGLANGLHERIDVLVEQRDREQRLRREVPLDRKIVGVGGERFEVRVGGGHGGGVGTTAQRRA